MHVNLKIEIKEFQQQQQKTIVIVVLEVLIDNWVIFWSVFWCAFQSLLEYFVQKFEGRIIVCFVTFILLWIVFLTQINKQKKNSKWIKRIPRPVAKTK